MDKKKLTPKKRVLRNWPDAYAYKWRDSWTVYGYMQGPALGDGKSSAQAWANAAEDRTGARDG